jgi:hypothetical protein
VIRLLLAALLLLAPAFGQNRFQQFDRDLKTAADELRISDLRAAVIESGRVVWQKGKITATAPEEPVIAERVPRTSLDRPAPAPPGATVREVLENRADGTPGQEVLENRSFFDALKPMAGNAELPDAVKFATDEHGTLGWFSQQYHGERVLWSYDPLLLLVRIPGKKLTLVVSANSQSLTEAAHLQDGNVSRSTVALALFKDVAQLGDSERDELIDRAFVALYFGQREEGASLVRQALDKFPELESAPDVTLLYLFSQLRLPQSESSATAVIRDHPSLPTAWFYYGMFLENSKRYREAAACFSKITEHRPPWHHWTVAAARRELTALQ